MEQYRKRASISFDASRASMGFDDDDNVEPTPRKLGYADSYDARSDVTTDISI